MARGKRIDKPVPLVRRNEELDRMLEESLASKPLRRAGDKVEATVFSIGQEYVFLDLGDRAEGLLPKIEVQDGDRVMVAPGDRVTVFTTGSRDGAVTCTLRLGAGGPMEVPAEKDAILAALSEAFAAGMPVEGSVKEVIKGGFAVTVMGQRAFCPISQIERGHCEAPEAHVGRTYGFSIVELGEGGRNIVVSRRRLLDREAEAKAAKLFETLEPGSVHEGVVASVLSYGAFVDIGGVEGLLHVSEIAYGRVSSPRDVLATGQKLMVAVKEVDREKRKVSLSLKALVEDPWNATLPTLTSDSVRRGRVTRIAPFGAFVELAPGVEGLLHVSEIGQGRRLRSPREVVREGDEVTVRILEVDAQRRRVSLAMGETDEDGVPVAEGSDAHEQAARPKPSLGTLGDLLGAALTQGKGKRR